MGRAGQERVKCYVLRLKNVGCGRMEVLSAE